VPLKKAWSGRDIEGLNGMSERISEDGPARGRTLRRPFQCALQGGAHINVGCLSQFLKVGVTAW
jgi:hypothetical protein